jgi:large subunit ribosomal protein L21
LAGEEGAALVFDKVLLVDKGGDVTVGAPTVAGAKITGKIVAHVRGEKVLVFKKKRRKSYQKMNGHRQNLTKVLIESITLK